MRSSQLLMATTKESPQDAELVSHQLMIRAGLIRKLASGVYSWLPNGLKVLQKVEAIIREEMNRANANEILMPNIIPADLWHETGRWDKFGPELLKISDNQQRHFCFGPTHEEVITDIARKEIKSYKQLPLNMYQIQTKFRNEVRPRFGLMRAREFIMKDAYSFHLSESSLNETYDLMRQAYVNILNRIGLDFRCVEADTGAMGGQKSHEFQVLAESGEDIICYASKGDYAANIEKAVYAYPDPDQVEPPQETLQLVETPGQNTIEKLARFLDTDQSNTIKIIIIKDADARFYGLILRGDHSLNDVKVSQLSDIKAPFEFASNQEIESLYGTQAGSLGPINSPIPLIVDYSASVMRDFICGANQNDKHYTGANWSRDVFDYQTADIRKVEKGDYAPNGQGVIKFAHGIEVGHIFYLGKAYSEKMNCNVLDQNGKSQAIIMGCYGFGLSRVIPAAIEQNHDQKGIIWPEAIAPYQLSIIPINMYKNAKVRETAEKIYRQLTNAGLNDVLFDDRDESTGAMFADHDLIGIPHQIIIGKKALDKGIVEYQSRIDKQKTEINAEEVLDFIQNNLL